jgi:hypothetical protein
MTLALVVFLFLGPLLLGSRSLAVFPLISSVVFLSYYYFTVARGKQWWRSFS